MKRLCAALLSLWLGACANVPAVAPAGLFEDSRFAAPSQPVRAADVFALSDAMRRYLDAEITRQSHRKGLQRGLIDALYSRGQLQARIRRRR